MRALAPWLYATSAAVLCSIVLAFLLGGLGRGSAEASLLCGALVGLFGYWQAPRELWRWPRLSGWECGAVVLFALFALRAFLWIVFHTGDEIQVLSPNNLGDLSLHVTYIRELANGEPFWPQNPILAGAQLTYPLGVDLLHSLLVLCGADIWRAFVWLGLAGSLLTGLALWRWGGAFTLAGFLGNGGLAGVAVFFTWSLTPEGFINWGLEDFQATFAWKSIPLALFVTQRGFLFALPAGLLLLCSWRARIFSGWGSAIPDPSQAREILPWWGELLLYASLQFFIFTPSSSSRSCSGPGFASSERLVDRCSG